MISKEAQDHFVVGPALGKTTKECEGARWEYTPLVNVPTHQTGGATGEHFLSSELTEAGQTKAICTVPSGLEGVTEREGRSPHDRSLRTRPLPLDHGGGRIRTFEGRATWFTATPL